MTFAVFTNKYRNPVALNANLVRRVWIGREGLVLIDFGEQYPEAVTDTFAEVVAKLGNSYTLPDGVPIAMRSVRGGSRTASDIVRGASNDLDDDIPL